MPRKPASQTPITSETMAYLHCWRKAHEQGEFAIPCTSSTEAERFKFLLYRAAKQLYANPQLAAEYPQFVRARENCSVRCAQHTAATARQYGVSVANYPWYVLVYRSDYKREVRSLIARLQLTPDDLRVPMSVSEQTITSNIPVPVSGPTATPCFHEWTELDGTELPDSTDDADDADDADDSDDGLPESVTAYFNR